MRNVVIIGDFWSEAREQILMAVRRGKGTVRFFKDGATARAALGLPRQITPQCVFVDCSARGAEDFVTWMRGEARFFSVPVVGVVPTISDAAFSEAHSVGADDVVQSSDTSGITRRVLGLATYDPDVRPPISKGRALVAHPDLSRRRVLGRILRQAGYAVAFAEQAAELVDLVDGAEKPALVVASTEITAGDFVEVAKRTRFVAADDVPIIVVGSPSSLRVVASAAQTLGRIALSSEYAPADNLLFLANELTRPGLQDLRSSERLLFGTVCAFRPAGTMTAVHGLTYNISRDGLYIRTMDPPPTGSEIWLELRPPHGGDAVHLRGRVMWARSVATGVGGAAPPGFGVQLDREASPPSDLLQYEAAYERLKQAPRFGQDTVAIAA